MPKLLLVVSMAVFASLPSAAQPSSGIELALGAGAAVYQGDLSPYRYGSFRKPGVSLQAMCLLPVFPALQMRVEYGFAALNESDQSYFFTYKQQRSFAFETKVNELSVQAVFYPLMLRNEAGFFGFMPYITAGVGMALLSVSRDWSKFNHHWNRWPKWVRLGLAADSAAVMPRSMAMLPAGAGIRYNFGENISLYAEVSHRFTKEDYLDGFSRSANPNRADAYSKMTVGIIFRHPSAKPSMYGRVY